VEALSVWTRSTRTVTAGLGLLSGAGVWLAVGSPSSPWATFGLVLAVVAGIPAVLLAAAVTQPETVYMLGFRHGYRRASH